MNVLTYKDYILYYAKVCATTVGDFLVDARGDDDFPDRVADIKNYIAEHGCIVAVNAERKCWKSYIGYCKRRGIEP